MVLFYVTIATISVHTLYVYLIAEYRSCDSIQYFFSREFSICDLRVIFTRKCTEFGKEGGSWKIPISFQGTPTQSLLLRNVVEVDIISFPLSSRDTWRVIWLLASVIRTSRLSRMVCSIILDNDWFVNQLDQPCLPWRLDGTWYGSRVYYSLVAAFGCGCDSRFQPSNVDQRSFIWRTSCFTSACLINLAAAALSIPPPSRVILLDWTILIFSKYCFTLVNSRKMGCSFALTPCKRR